MTLETTEAGTARLHHGDRSASDTACRFVEELVGGALGVGIAELRRPSRGRAPVAFARQTAMYLAHVHFGLSLERVGQHFGRDRTTVAHACKRVEDSRDKPRFEVLLAYLEAVLQCWRRSLAEGGRAP
jgi:chromosomal replication initiation ATPase DnaA